MYAADTPAIVPMVLSPRLTKFIFDTAMIDTISSILGADLQTALR